MDSHGDDHQLDNVARNSWWHCYLRPHQSLQLSLQDLAWDFLLTTQCPSNDQILQRWQWLPTIQLHSENLWSDRIHPNAQAFDSFVRDQSHASYLWDTEKPSRTTEQSDCGDADNFLRLRSTGHGHLRRKDQVWFNLDCRRLFDSGQLLPYELQWPNVILCDTFRPDCRQ